MALNINGTTGISGVDGSASAPAVTGTDSNTGINFASDTVNINTGGSTRATFDSNGRLGIGTTSPSSLLELSGGGNVTLIVNTGNNSGDNSQIAFGDSADADVGFINYDHGTNAMQFRVNASERMRITSDGALLLGTNSVHNTGQVFSITGAAHIMEIQNTSTAGHRTITLRHSRASGGTSAEQIVFEETGGGAVGSIQSTGSATSYNTSSDYRLKENESAISDGITRLKTLKPYRFNFKVDASTTVDGFFAHEVTAVPEAITGTKDAVVTQAMIDAGEYTADKLDQEIHQGIDQSKLVPLLTAALQEAIAKIEVLETKVAALEAE